MEKKTVDLGYACIKMLASFPVPRPAFRRCLVQLLNNLAVVNDVVS